MLVMSTKKLAISKYEQSYANYHYCYYYYCYY